MRGDAPRSGPAELARLDLVAPIPSSMDDAVREAVGAPGAQVHHHPAGVGSAFGALAAAAGKLGPDEAGLVIAVDLESGTGSDAQWGSSAIALRVEGALGVEVIVYGELVAAPNSGATAPEWGRRALHAIREQDSSSVVGLVLASSTDPPPAVSWWEGVAPGSPFESVSVTLPGVGAPPSVSALAALRYLKEEPEPRPVCLVALSGERGAFLGVRERSPIHWVPDGKWTDPRTENRTLSRLPAATPPPAVSQGAYIPRPTYEQSAPSRWRLVADRCPSCGTVTFPSRGACRSCGQVDGLRAEALALERLEVEAVTTIMSGAQPTEFDDQVEESGPYDVVIARTTADVRVTAQVADDPAGTIDVGDFVDLHVRRLFAMEGEWRYGLKASRSAPVTKRTTTRAASR